MDRSGSQGNVFNKVYLGKDEMKYMESWYECKGCNGKGLVRTQWHNMLGSHNNG